MKNLIALTLLLGGSTLLCAQKPAKTPATYKPVKSEIYRKGWIDFNKNGVKDVYEAPSAPLEARIENLLQQMTLDEKTCQMVTLYGVTVGYDVATESHFATQAGGEPVVAALHGDAVVIVVRTHYAQHASFPDDAFEGVDAVSYTHLTLPTN